MSEAAKDYISDLPACLLHHIHSFLEIKDGARTSVLSKRWNYIWTTVPTLHFKSLVIPASSESDKFMDFVDGTLHRHSSSTIDKFSLVCNRRLNESLLHSWISTVIKGNVKDLRLRLHVRQPLFFPPSLFTCESLISLELGPLPNFSFPKLICFPRLKRLKLYDYKFSDECWNEELLTNFPILEELILQLCIYSMRNLCISVPTLKLLDIESWDTIEDGLLDCALEIHAPGLVTFKYFANAAKEFVLSSFPTLVEAVVSFNCVKHGAEISRLLRAVAHVKRLTVNDLTLQATCFACDTVNNFLTFYHVKILNVTGELTNDQGLIALLKAVPNLESLVFYEYMNGEEEDSDEDDDVVDDGAVDNAGDDAEYVEGENNHGSDGEGDVSDTSDGDVEDDGAVDNIDDDAEDDSWGFNIVITGSLFPQLKSVCFQLFAGNPREMRWLKLILRDAKALQMMTIGYDSYIRFVNAKSENELMVEIHSFPRSSIGCVFKFLSD